MSKNQKGQNPKQDEKAAKPESKQDKEAAEPESKQDKEAAEPEPKQEAAEPESKQDKEAAKPEPKQSKKEAAWNALSREEQEAVLARRAARRAALKKMMKRAGVLLGGLALAGVAFTVLSVRQEAAKAKLKDEHKVYLVEHAEELAKREIYGKPIKYPKIDSKTKEAVFAKDMSIRGGVGLVSAGKHCKVLEQAHGPMGEHMARISVLGADGKEHKVVINADSLTTPEGYKNREKIEEGKVKEIWNRAQKTLDDPNATEAEKEAAKYWQTELAAYQKIEACQKEISKGFVPQKPTSTSATVKLGAAPQ